MDKLSGLEPSTKRWLKVGLPALATVVVIGLLVHEVELAPLLAAFADADPLYSLAACALALFFNTVQSAEVLRHTLAGFGVKVSAKGALKATVGNLAIHAVLPAGTGNVGRLAYLARTEGADLSRGTLAAAALLWMKLVALFGLASIGYFVAEDPPPWHAPLAFGGFAVTLALTFLAPRLARALTLELPGKLGRIVGALRAGLGELHARSLALGAVHAFVAVAIELLVFQLCLFAVGAPAAPALILAWFPLIVIVAKVPVTLMGLGTREVTCVLLFASLAPAPALLAASLIYSFAEHLLSALVGTLLTYRFVRTIVD